MAYFPGNAQNDGLLGTSQSPPSPLRRGPHYRIYSNRHRPQIDAALK